jgi:S1-C subfamily serine protease
MIVDLVIVIILIYSVVRSYRSGFLRQFWSALGFFGGLIIGRLLTVFTLSLSHDVTSKALITVITIFGMAILGLSIGEYVGIRLKYQWLHTKFNRADNIIGSIFTIVLILFSLWLVASVITRLPSDNLTKDVKNSKIIGELNKLLPPAPGVISDLSHLIDPNGFPDVFIGSEPIPKGNVSLPNLGEFQTAVNKDKNSVDRIQGYGCGGIVSGSGFVIGPNLVATNAHVVAGISSPIVEDVNGHHKAQVIWFDPNLDFAVLRTTNLGGQPLGIDLSNKPSGTQGVVLGYPGGGNFSANPAAILEEPEASGRNIYDSGVTLRNVYEIQATVIPGNSGGPLIESDGKVMGVVFAQSTTYQNVGYALAMNKVANEIVQAENSNAPVSTGQCAQ